MTLKCAVGISTYNGNWRVEELLSSIRQHTEYPKEDYKIVVIDDGSREDYLIALRETCSRFQVPLREHRQNLGISATWNHLTRYFGETEERAEYNILINDDIFCTDYWLTSLMYFLENNKCGTAGLPLLFGSPHDDKATIMRPDQGDKNVNAGPDVTSIKPGRVMAAPGCLFGFKRSLFDEIGGFDENFKSFYEEVSFGTECAKRGYPSYAMSWPRVWHMWGATFAANPELEASKRMSESRAYYIQKWGGDHTATNPRYMSQIPSQKIKWWTPYGILEAEDV